MIDCTITGSCSRLANEGAVPVFVEKMKKYSLGGCGNVAANLVAMGAEVVLISVEGNDKLVSKHFYNNKNSFCVVNKDSRTTIKTRAFADNKLVFRHDIEDSAVSPKDRDELLLIFSYIFSLYDISCVVISDYNRGVCTEELCRQLIRYSNLLNIPIVVDPKVDCEKYMNCTLLKPNLQEARRLTGLETADTFDLHRALNKKTKARYTCITQASEGLSLYDHVFSEESRYKVPKLEVCDVTGAGDIVCATLAYSISAGIDPYDMIKSATFLATASVKHAGSYVLSKEDFWDLRQHLRPNKQISIGDIPNIYRTNKRVVFTNGCFDIFHKGHVQSLTASKNFGDILIVGLNSDKSIKRLKGDGRPIMDWEQRLSIISALEVVDYVIIFDEDTPERLLALIKPDVYVKGEEYRNKPLAGSEYSKAVEYIEFKTVMSTTAIVNKLKENVYLNNTL